MNKGTKKKPVYNQDAIEILIQKYGYSSYYLRQCISGAKKGVVPDELKKEYKEICKTLEHAKNEAINKLRKIDTVTK